MKRKIPLLALALGSALAAFAQGREDFARQQAYAEMQRVTGQIDVLAANVGELSQRVTRLEGRGDDSALRSEVAALRSEIAELKAAMQAQRGEIVKDLAARLSKLPPPAKPSAPKPAPVGPHYEYTVSSGDSLYLIARAFNTTISKIKAMNALKGDNLRIGQKIKVPKEQ